MPRASAAVALAPIKAFFRVVTSAEAREQLAAFAPKTASETIPTVDACGRVLGESADLTRGPPHIFTAPTWTGMPSVPKIRSVRRPVCQCISSSSVQWRWAKTVNRASKKARPCGSQLGVCYRPGADSMVMVEYTEEMGDGTIEVQRSTSPWENILRIGEDIKKGAAIFSAGRRLRAHDLGALTGVGLTKVPVHRRPKVALISTGDEIVAPDQSPKPGQVRNVNQYSLRAMITEAGGEAVDLGVVKDDRPAFEKAMAHALKVADVVMISGGSSVGIKDMTVDVICSFPKSEIFFHGFRLRRENRRSSPKPGESQ